MCTPLHTKSPCDTYIRWVWDLIMLLQHTIITPAATTNGKQQVVVRIMKLIAHLAAAMFIFPRLCVCFILGLCALHFRGKEWCIKRSAPHDDSPLLSLSISMEVNCFEKCGKTSKASERTNGTLELEGCKIFDLFRSPNGQGYSRCVCVGACARLRMFTERFVCYCVSAHRLVTDSGIFSSSCFHSLVHPRSFQWHCQATGSHPSLPLMHNIARILPRSLATEWLFFGSFFPRQRTTIVFGTGPGKKAVRGRGGVVRAAGIVRHDRYFFYANEPPVHPPLANLFCGGFFGLRDAGSNMGRHIFSPTSATEG